MFFFAHPFVFAYHQILVSVARTVGLVMAVAVVVVEPMLNRM